MLNMHSYDILDVFNQTYVILFMFVAIFNGDKEAVKKYQQMLDKVMTRSNDGRHRYYTITYSSVSVKFSVEGGFEYSKTFVTQIPMGS